MKRHVAFVVALLLSVSEADCAALSSSEPVNVLFSLSVDQNDLLTLSVYNPTSQAACTSYLNWPGGGDVLRVVGTNGQRWTYIGLEADPVGRTEELIIAPHSEVMTTVELRKSYKSIAVDDRVGKVYFGAPFMSC